MLSAILFGLATGSLLGLLGGGGSIIAVPILVYALGYDTKSAIGTSLIIVGVASLFAVVSHWRQRSVLPGVASLFALSGVFGSYIGAALAQGLDDVVQLMMFAATMAVVGVIMLKRSGDTESSIAVQAKAKLPLVISSGAVAGLLTGLLGVGGGFIIVPALSLVLGLPIKEAIGTSLFVIAINSLVGGVAYAGHLRFSGTVLPFAIGTLTAAPLAGHLSGRVPQNQLKSAFAWLLIALSSLMIFRQLLGF